MSSSSLINLTPLLQVMLMGLTVALGPLAWWWLQHRGANKLKRLQTLTTFTLFLSFDLVVFGAFTRLSDSGLGCPDWPGCYGSASPIGALVHIDAAQVAMPTGPVTLVKAWIEMLHRYLATGVGVLILTLTMHAWWLRYRAYKSKQGAASKVRHLSEVIPKAQQQISPWWPTASLVWVMVVGAFGALTVTWKLFPAIVTLHLLGALVLLGLLCKQVALYTQAVNSVPAHGIHPPLHLFMLAVFALLWVQIALGGWVSTNYAVLACNTFPACQNAWWPAMDFEQGFEIWRKLGLTSGGAVLSFQALTAIHYVHRLMAYVVLIALAALAWSMFKVQALQRTARWLAGLAAWQLLTGLSNVVLDWPLLAALAHTAGAALLVIVMTWVLCITTSQRTLKFSIKNRAIKHIMQDSTVPKPL